MYMLQEASSAKELKELRAHNETLKRSSRDSEEAAARRVAESESQRAASDSAARHATAKVFFFGHSISSNQQYILFP